MGKSKSSGGSELDPAIRQMMQETFNLGKGVITESRPVLDADGNQIIDYVTGPGGSRIPIPRTTTPGNVARIGWVAHFVYLLDRQIKSLSEH